MKWLYNIKLVKAHLLNVVTTYWHDWMTILYNTVSVNVYIVNVITTYYLMEWQYYTESVNTYLVSNKCYNYIYTSLNNNTHNAKSVNINI